MNRPADTIHRAQVLRAQRLTPGMTRIVFGGRGLEEFSSTGVGDEYFRIFFPLDHRGEPTLPLITEDGGWDYPKGVEPAPMRTYTVRRWDDASRELTVDFVVHDGGVAASWALDARPGDIVGVNAPRGLYDPPRDITWQLLVADATGLPAAIRLAETAPASVRTRLILEVSGPADEQEIEFAPGVELQWVHGGNGHTPTRIEEIVRSVGLPATPGYVWVAGETTATRGIRRHLRHGLKLPSTAYKVVGYWTENAEIWREKYDSLPDAVLDRLASMWDDTDRDVEEITDEYEAELEKLGL